MATLPRHFLDRHLQALREDLVRLSRLFDIALHEAFCALVNQDTHLALAVIANDNGVNALRYQIEAGCLEVIATQQPTAHDLRSIMALFSMAVDLERMADHAAGIATLVVRLDDEPPLPIPAGLRQMAEACARMTCGALEAYLQADANLAQTIVSSDAVVDRLYAEVFQELLEAMLKTPGQVARALSLMFVAHNLERIGDRAVNLANWAQFAASLQAGTLAMGTIPLTVESGAQTKPFSTWAG
jgi:phosphate transport system protein